MTSPLSLRLLELSASSGQALRDDHRAVSFSELIDTAFRSGAALRAGKPSLEGRRVAILASPSVAWVEGFLGVILAGGVALPLSPLYPDKELAWFLEDAEADILLVSRDLIDRAAALGGPPVLVIEELSRDCREQGDEQRALDLSSDAAALVLYTSGTTGKPKGALISHANIATQASLLREAWGYREDDVLLHALPLHHLHGLGIALLTSLLAGATTRMLSRFDPRRVWDELDRASIWMAVPTMYQRLFEAFDRGSDEDCARWANHARGLRLATSGSAALPVTLAERWRALMGAIPLERFGMTEIGVGLSNSLDPEARKPGWVGRPLPTVEIRLVDDAGDDVEGSTGELWVRGPSVFGGYLRRETASRAAFVDGWFKTGDLAERSPDGAFRLLGRTSVDILKSGGYKLSALEIEEVLREHDGVREVAVVGVPDATWGDRVVAVVVPHEGRAASLETEILRAWARERLAPYKIPRQVIVVDALAKNPIGKVLKPDLIRAIAEGRLGR
jgi:malonyl-CoA/methylmalonyl-CoA synthetase